MLLFGLLELLGGLLHGDLDLGLGLQVVVELLLVFADLVLVVGLGVFGDLLGQGLVLVLERRLLQDRFLELVLDVLYTLTELRAVVLGKVLLQLVQLGLLLGKSLLLLWQVLPDCFALLNDLRELDIDLFDLLLPLDLILSTVCDLSFQILVLCRQLRHLLIIPHNLLLDLFIFLSQSLDFSDPFGLS